jgi:hypothetical protein
MRNFRPALPLILLSLVSVGCYVPEPASLASIEPGADFRIVLNEEGRERLNEVSADTRGEVRGQLLSLTEDSLTLTTRLRGPERTPTFSTLRQPLTFSRANIEQVTVPRLDGLRTGAVALGVAVVGVTVIRALLDFVGSNDNPTDPPDPTAPFWVGWSR